MISFKTKAERKAPGSATLKHQLALVELLAISTHLNPQALEDAQCP